MWCRVIESENWATFLIFHSEKCVNHSLPCFVVTSRANNRGMSQILKISDEHDYHKYYTSKDEADLKKSTRHGQKMPKLKYTSYQITLLTCLILVILPFLVTFILADLLEGNLWDSPIYVVKCLIFQTMVSTVLIPQANSTWKNFTIGGLE